MGHQTRGSTKETYIMHILIDRMNAGDSTESPEFKKLQRKLWRMTTDQVIEYDRTYRPRTARGGL